MSVRSLRVSFLKLTALCSPNGLGAGLSSLISGRIMDFYYRREKKRVRGDHRARPEEFRLERTRFLIFPYQVG